MKKLFLALSLLIVQSSFGGTIINKYNGHAININLDENVVSLEFRLDKISVKTISYDKYRNDLNGSVEEQRGWVEKPFSSVKSTIEDARNYKSMILAIPLAATMDVIFLPFTVPNTIGMNAAIEKDLAIISQALNSDEVVEVSWKRFERILFYLNGRNLNQ